MGISTEGLPLVNNPPSSDHPLLLLFTDLLSERIGRFCRDEFKFAVTNLEMQAIMRVGHEISRPFQFVKTRNTGIFF